MANLGFSACSLSVFLAAVAGQAPCAKGVLIEKELLVSNQLDVFGRSHTAMGAADLSLTLGGTLVVSNIGSSGLDGVTFPLGDVRGHSISMDMGDRGALAPGAKVEMFLPYRFGEQTIFIQEQNGGSARFGVGGSYPPPQRLTVTVLDNGVPVDSRCVAPASFPSLVTGDMGSDPVSGQGFSISFEQVEWDYVATLTLPADSQLTIPGSPIGPVTGDQVRVSMEGLPPGQAPSGDIRVVCTNLGQDLEIRSEDVILPGLSRLQLPGITNAPYDITVGKRARALGGALLEGMAEAAACQSHPKSWFFSTRLLDTTRALSVSNLGSSGLDGVSIVYGGGGTPCGIGFTQCPDGSCVVDPSDCSTSVPQDRVVYIGGKDPAFPDYLDMDSDDDGITLAATGSSGGSSGVHFGTVTLRNAPGGGNELDLHADFSSIGSDLVSVAVYSGGAFVGEFQQLVQPGVSLATILPSPDGIDLDACGKFVGGPPFGPPCFFFSSAAQFTLFGGGQLLVGDECRVLAAGNPTPIDFIDTLDITGTNLEPFDLRLESDADVWPVTGRGTVAMGTRMHAVGGATVSTSPDGALVVSNLGSSGEDGVAVDIGKARSASMGFGGGTTYSFDTTIFMSVAAYEPEQVGAPAQEIMTVQTTSTTPDHVQLSARHLNGSASFDVSLRDDRGQLVGLIQMDQTQTLSVMDPSGVGVTLAGSSQRLSDPDGGPYVCGITSHFIAGGGGGGGGSGGTVDVLSPAGVLFEGVSFVDTVFNSVNLDRCCRGHVIIMKRGDSSGTRALAEDLLIAFFSKKGYDFYASRGGARTNIEICDSSTGTDQFLTVANLGSSGEDGVSIDLSGDTCRIDNACCIDDDCDGDVDDIWFTLDRVGGTGFDMGWKYIPSRVVAKSLNSSVPFEAEVRVTPGPAGPELGVSLSEDGVPIDFGVELTLYDAGNFPLAVFVFSPPEVTGAQTIYSTCCATGIRRTHFKEDVVAEYDSVARRIRKRPDLLLQEWDQLVDVSIPRFGVTQPGVSRCEVRILPGPAGPAYFDSTSGADLTFTAPAGELGTVEITDQGHTRFAPPCPADVNGDGVIDNGDIGIFITLFLAQDPRVDFTGDGVVDNGDIGAFIAAFLAGC